MDEEPLYVNAKQYYRILKRRVARARIEELHRLSRQRKVSIVRHSLSPFLCLEVSFLYRISFCGCKGIGYAMPRSIGMWELFWCLDEVPGAPYARGTRENQRNTRTADHPKPYNGLQLSFSLVL